MKVIEQCLEIHWATSPLNESLFCVCRFKNTINPVVGNYQDISEIILLKFSWKSLNNNKCLEVLGIEPRTSYMRSMRSTTELHPLSKSPFCFCRFSKSFNSKSTAQTCNMFPQICMKHYKLSLEMLGIEPRTSYMQSMRSTTELHPHLMRVFSAFVDLKTL